jgi:hypothetical protein
MSAMVAFLDPREAWRPLKPARVEPGQRWRYKPSDGEVFTVRHLGTSCSANYRVFGEGGEYRGEAEHMLTCDDWEWVVEP